MRCPECDAKENRVVDTRTSRGGRAVRRRRQCGVCGARFTTYEYVEERPVQVLKRDGSTQALAGQMEDLMSLNAIIGLPEMFARAKKYGAE